MEFNENNVSTLVTIIWTSIIAPILVYFGIEIDQALGVGVLTAIVTIIIMIWNAKNPNEIEAFGNKPVAARNNGVLNDEYVTGDDDGC